MSNPRRYRGPFKCAGQQPAPARKRRGLNGGHLINLAAVLLVAATLLEVLPMIKTRTQDMLPDAARLTGAGYREPMRHFRVGRHTRKDSGSDRRTYRHNKRGGRPWRNS